MPRICRIWTETLNRGARGGSKWALGPGAGICRYWTHDLNLALAMGGKWVLGLGTDQAGYPESADTGYLDHSAASSLS